MTVGWICKSTDAFLSGKEHGYRWRGWCAAHRSWRRLWRERRRQGNQGRWTVSTSEGRVDLQHLCHLSLWRNVFDCQSQQRTKLLLLSTERTLSRQWSTIRQPLEGSSSINSLPIPTVWLLTMLTWLLSSTRTWCGVFPITTKKSSSHCAGQISNLLQYAHGRMRHKTWVFLFGSTPVQHYALFFTCSCLSTGSVMHLPQYSSLPAKAFSSGYLSSFCKHVGYTKA